MLLSACRDCALGMLPSACGGCALGMLLPRFLGLCVRHAPCGDCALDMLSPRLQWPIKTAPSPACGGGPGRGPKAFKAATHHVTAQLHTRPRWLSHARRIRTACRLLDAMAGTTEQLADGRETSPGGIRGCSQRHCNRRAGYGWRITRTVRECARHAPGCGSRRGAVERRCVDARCRTDVRGERCRRGPWRRLDLQCMGRVERRVVF